MPTAPADRIGAWCARSLSVCRVLPRERTWWLTSLHAPTGHNPERRRHGGRSRLRGVPLSTAALVAAIVATACVAQPVPLTVSRGIMGTEFRVVVASDDTAGARRAAWAALDRVDALNAILSDYLPASELSRLSDTAGSDTFVTVSGDLWNVLRRSYEIASLTDGAFDPTVGRLTRLWRRAFRRNSLPDSSDIGEALKTVGFRSIDFDTARGAIRLGLPGTRLDLGGIAKGYAADEALAMLQSLGYPNALVDAGGDVRLGDPPAGRNGWHIIIPSVDGDGNPGQQLEPAARLAVAASGDTYRYVEADGKRYSHIIDPRTGMGVTFRRIVAVAAPSGMDADALASAFSVLPVDQQPRILENFANASARVLVPSADGFTAIDTPGWPFKSPDPE